ncbi:hypothetical protein [Pelosinus propionicus]|uniref:hypothetical protein n=1 Tax=Pelosinus propionicus TaxID=380084 RepID=UPI001113FABC|nr:hypothetical protein [Pelosinus propionicus]
MIQNIVNFLAVITVLIIVANAGTVVVNAPKKVFTDRKNNSKNRSIVAEKKDLYILQTNLKS